MTKLTLNTFHKVTLGEPTLLSITQNPEPL